MPGLDITPPLSRDSQLIQAYGNGGFRVAGRSYQGSLLVFPTRTVSWAVADVAAVTVDSLAEVTGDARPNQILVIGCGSRSAPPPEGLREGLREAGVVLEWMDTGAACRTFNVLLIDDRPVTAALIAVD